VDRGEVEVGLRAPRTELDDFAVHARRAILVAPTCEHPGQQDAGVEVVRVELDGAGDAAIRVVEVAAADVERGQAGVEPRLVGIERGGGFELLQRAVVVGVAERDLTLEEVADRTVLGRKVEVDRGQAGERTRWCLRERQRGACLQRHDDRRDREKPLHRVGRRHLPWLAPSADCGKKF
jgi:hypothetical protein